MIRSLVLFLVRKKLGLKKYEEFRFANQRSEHNFYYIDEDGIWKCEPFGDNVRCYNPSTVSLNYLLSSECKVVKV
jgi:hypothetical protein